MPNYQSAIVTKNGPFALYVLFKVTGDVKCTLSSFSQFQKTIDEINSKQPYSNLKTCIAFTPSFCFQHNILCPENSKDFQPLGKPPTYAPATDCDIFLHVHSSRHDLNFYALKKLLEDINDDVQILDETYGFKYLDSRDLTDFIDGTENPKTDKEREEVAIIKEGEHVGGSFIFVQRYVHKLAAWSTMSISEQEKIIGRTQPDSIELEDNHECSHVERVDIKREGKGLKLVRHSLPYGTVSGDHGLLFLSYCHAQSIIQTLIESMFGELDGKTDHLLNYTNAVTGAYFFAPSQEVLASLK